MPEPAVASQSQGNQKQPVLEPTLQQRVCLERIRGRHQRKVDEVDIAAPTEWLHHHANTVLRLHRDAQASLQLQRRSAASSKRTPADSGASRNAAETTRLQLNLSGKVKSAVAKSLSIDKRKYFKAKRERRASRVVCGGDLLPWGSWPVRLRNHDGESFYDSGHDVRDGCPSSVPFWTADGGVGGSGSVAGVGTVAEHSIHDRLLRRRYPSCRFCSRGSIRTDDDSCNHPQQDGVVSRFLPNKRGRWVEVSPAVATVGGAHDEDHQTYDCDGVVGSKSPLPTTSAEAVEVPKGKVKAAVLKRLRPGWYGGWIDAEQTLEDSDVRAQASSATTNGARDYDDDKASDRLDRESASTVPLDAESALDVEAERPETGRSSCMCSPCGKVSSTGCTGGGENSPGQKRPWQGAIECDNYDSAAGQSYNAKNTRQGWTIAQPAVNTVRRVWGRSTRRARDTLKPRLCANESHNPRNPNDGANQEVTSRVKRARNDTASLCDSTSARRAADRSYSHSTLDAGLLSILGQECEGIIDATLHLILSTELRRSSSAMGDDQKLAPTDWEHVMTMIMQCSSAARMVDRENAKDAPHRIPKAEAAREAWGEGEASDGAVAVVHERLPALPLNSAMITRVYNRLLLYLYERAWWESPGS